jgi:hypothetical protein
MKTFQSRIIPRILALIFIITASSCQTTQKAVPTASPSNPPSQQTFSRVSFNFNVDWKYFMGDASNAGDNDFDNLA